MDPEIFGQFNPQQSLILYIQCNVLQAREMTYVLSPILKDSDKNINIVFKLKDTTKFSQMELTDLYITMYVNGKESGIPKKTSRLDRRNDFLVQSSIFSIH